MGRLSNKPKSSNPLKGFSILAKQIVEVEKIIEIKVPVEVIKEVIVEKPIEIIKEIQVEIKVEDTSKIEELTSRLVLESGVRIALQGNVEKLQEINLKQAELIGKDRTSILDLEVTNNKVQVELELAEDEISKLENTIVSQNNTKVQQIKDLKIKLYIIGSIALLLGIFIGKVI